MANAGDVQKTVVKVLHCLEKVSSFASSIDPIFGVVSSLVGLARKGLADEETNPLDKDFQEIHTKLESISQQNQQCLRQIHINEVNQNYGKYEEYIKHQYTAFNTMVAQIKKDPDNTQRHMKNFEDIYERDKSNTSLDVFYRGVIGEFVFGKKPLLEVYLEHCEFDRAIMEYRCLHLIHLFHVGLISLMAYTAVTEDDEDMERTKWAKRVVEIQAKMQEALAQCNDQKGS